MSGQLLVISPVRDEATSIPQVIEAVAAQTRRPDMWLIVDDGSTDDTLAMARAHERRLSFLRVAPPHAADAGGLLAAAEIRAWNRGLALADPNRFSYVAKLDGDMVIPPDYYERVLAELERDRSLGIAGGVFSEQRRAVWSRVVEPSQHVAGGLKVYRRECLESIGGLPEVLGWDTADEVRARSLGYATRAFDSLVARHLRPCGGREGRFAGPARYGRAAHALGYGLPWVLARAGRTLVTQPLTLYGPSYLFGYLSAAVGGEPRLVERGSRPSLRSELRRRLSASGGARPT